MASKKKSIPRILSAVGIFLAAANLLLRYRILKIGVLKALVLAYQDGAFDLRRPFVMGLPISDPKSVNFSQFRGYRSIKFVTSETVIPPTSFPDSLTAGIH